MLRTSIGTATLDTCSEAYIFPPLAEAEQCSSASIFSLLSGTCSVQILLNQRFSAYDLISDKKCTRERAEPNKDRAAIDAAELFKRACLRQGDAGSGRQLAHFSRDMIIQ